MLTQKLKRIDIIGNANNYPLTIARAMRTQGIDAHLHLVSSHPLNLPENRYLQYQDNYPDWIHSWLPVDMLWPNLKLIEKLQAAVSNSDALVLNYDAVHLGAEWEKPYFCLLTGSDLLTYCSPSECPDAINFSPEKNSTLGELRYKRSWSEFILQQRAAIRNANKYYFFPSGLLPQGDALLNDLHADPSLRISFLLTDTEELKLTPPPANIPMHVVYAARLTWDKTSPPFRTELDYKGGDIFLTGVADFINQNGQIKLHLFRKGDHLLQTEALCESLNITSHIIWHDEVTQIEFLEVLKQADLVIDQTGSSHIGMAAMDALALGRPVLAKAPDSALWGIQNDFPVCAAETAAEVCAWLLKLNTNIALRASLGQRGRTFVEQHFSAKQAAEKIMLALSRPALPSLEIEIYKQMRQLRIAEDAHQEKLEKLELALGQLSIDNQRIEAYQRHPKISQNIFNLLDATIILREQGVLKLLQRTFCFMQKKIFK